MSTEIILTADVENVGIAGDVVKVSDGFARNYLLPQGKAVPADAGNLRRIELLRKKREAELAAQLEEAKKTAKRIVAHTARFKTPAGSDGKLFGSITANDIAKDLKEAGIEVDRRKIALEHPIREVGVFEVDIKLHADVVQKIKVVVESSTPDAAPAAPAQS
jgi:large subunit ribosomal protein L9